MEPKTLQNCLGACAVLSSVPAQQCRRPLNSRRRALSCHQSPPIPQQPPSTDVRAVARAGPCPSASCPSASCPSATLKLLTSAPSMGQAAASWVAPGGPSAADLDSRRPLNSRPLAQSKRRQHHMIRLHVCRAGGPQSSGDHGAPRFRSGRPVRQRSLSSYIILASQPPPPLTHTFDTGHDIHHRRTGLLDTVLHVMGLQWCAALDLSTAIPTTDQARAPPRRWRPNQKPRQAPSPPPGASLNQRPPAPWCAAGPCRRRPPPRPNACARAHAPGKCMHRRAMQGGP